MTRARSATVFVASVMAVTGVALVLTPTSSNAEPGAEWSNNGTGWSGSGTVFLPGGKHVGPSDGSNSCPGCSWQLHTVCELEGENSCAVNFGCEPGRPFVLIVLREPGSVATTVGAQCMNGDPVSSEQLGTLITDRVRQDAPVARPRFQPSTAALTALPTNFRSGQAQSIRRSESIAGIPVSFEATARWRWTWGDGSAALTTRAPGGAWPTMSVTHTYRRPGTRSVVLQTLWTASYTVSGAGPFSVEGPPVTQSTSVSVPVQEARAVLIGAQIG